MSEIRWPEPFNEQGRLSEGAAAQSMGKSALAGETPGCPQTLHVNLFFDGTNNNLEEDIKSAERPTHSNVARLFNACSYNYADGEYRFYVPGVGTPFPEIGEKEFTAKGKAFAAGFGMRVAWGYTRLLNAVHEAIVGDILLYDPDARALCSLIDDEVIATNGTVVSAVTNIAKTSRIAGVAASSPMFYYGYKVRSKLERLHGELSALQRKHSSPGGQLNRSIKKVWVNVFGFSRGAAGARVFVNRLINTWAPGGKIAGAIPYEVNFLGIFDTVASVGIPDTATAAINRVELDGHWAWTSRGALNVPISVKKCVHFFSIHEQRMSFPLDSIRERQIYPIGEPRRIEIAYPGVHSDVGGGYPVGDQGKSRAGEGSKLSQIALHNMYIEALKAGVPLLTGNDKNPLPKVVGQDFRISSAVVHAFNDWLSTVNQKPLDSVETALRIGMGQSLAWRTLRADVGNSHTYITSQEFFRRAREDQVTPYGLEKRLEKKGSSARLDGLKREKRELEIRKNTLEAAALGTIRNPLESNVFKKRAEQLAEQIKKKDKEILEAAADNGKESRPGEGATDITTNDKTDLLEAAEEFRLVLAYLRPDQRTRLQVYWSQAPAKAVKMGSGLFSAEIFISQNPNAYYLTVDRKDAGSHRRQGSNTVWLGDRDLAIQLLGAVAAYQPVLDFVLAPETQMLPFLLEHTSDEAVRKLSPAVVRLMDDYVHDSRAWFRVPYFHEYSPGGYGWARTFFVGNDRRVRNLGLTDQATAVAASREQKAAADRGKFVVERSRTLPPPVKVDFSTFPR
ncbi:T6SS phospholipase effector Tle1-like catalytic domain-containing protein [Burkholderia lata]|uniref:T6SS Phospholipase effector Tle1-like catalytic domain-containing protein n=1 Tax=Burkholderia lata (strain ATCC 17760 / DSM 23089 / LMG 22485 / NCIMB 9086 / R18194 / 383) TaxID=482957 RepID=Q398K8_BURL3|nr:DUF2235 domain-containing protein [Burkholderia lata]ABB11103.1 hypothetical protein Bcep18194_B0989 [Burkholderia lata]